MFYYLFLVLLCLSSGIIARKLNGLAYDLVFAVHKISTLLIIYGIYRISVTSVNYLFSIIVMSITYLVITFLFIHGAYISVKMRTQKVNMKLHGLAGIFFVLLQIILFLVV